MQNNKVIIFMRFLSTCFIRIRVKHNLILKLIGGYRVITFWVRHCHTITMALLQILMFNIYICIHVDFITILISFFGRKNV